MDHPAARPHTGRRRSALLSSALATLLLPLAAALPAAGPSPAQAATSEVVDLVDNGSFEDGTVSWRTNRKRQILKATRPSVSGQRSARLKVTVPGRTVLKNSRPTVSTADTEAVYTLKAYVRSTGRVIPGRLRVREIRNGTIVKRHWTKFRAGRDWKQVRLQFTPSRAAALDVSIAGEKLGVHVALLVDDISLRSDKKQPPTEPTPTEPTPTEPSPTPTEPVPDETPTTCVSDPMGIPAEGTTYLGAAVSGTSDLDDREASFEQTLPLHRTYYSASQINGAVRTAKEDLAAGRLPWISFKAPLSWADMAAGKGNDWSRQLADGLATVPGPVWLAVHHEPEGDGDMALWTEMQRQIAPIIHNRTDNVAYSVIYSGWNTYGGGKNNVATKWPGDQHIDILAIDAYNDYGVVRSGKTITNSLDIKAYFLKMADFAQKHGTAWAIAETAQSPAGADYDPGWMARAYRDMKALGGAGMSWFDSSQHSVADWTLDYHVKFNAYDELLPESVRVC